MRLDEPIPVTTPHGRMLREPKGGPDAILVGAQQQADALVRAANILSVQGWTARIVLLSVDSLAALPGEERETLLGGAPVISALGQAAPEAGALAAAALAAIRS